MFGRLVGDLLFGSLVSAHIAHRVGSVWEGGRRCQSHHTRGGRGEGEVKMNSGCGWGGRGGKRRHDKRKGKMELVKMRGCGPRETRYV